MPKKIHPERISLQFDFNDDMQRKAAHILNGKGRKKAEYISAAIEAYEENNKLSASEVYAVIENFLRSNGIINEQIKEKSLKTPVCSNISKEAALNEKKTETDISKDIITEEQPNEVKNFILDTLKQFTF